MSESVLAASGFSLVSLWFQAEKGTLSPLECLSFANTIQADLPTKTQNWPNPKTGTSTGLIPKLVQFQIWFNPKSRFYENKTLYIFKMRTLSNGLSPYRSSPDKCWSLECQAWAKDEQRRLGVWGPFSKDFMPKDIFQRNFDTKGPLTKRAFGPEELFQ